MPRPRSSWPRSAPRRRACPPHLERTRREAEAAAAAGEADRESDPEAAAAVSKQELHEGAGADVTVEDLREALAVATFQRAEAMRVAERLRALALTQAVAAASPRQGGTSFVFRVLELAEERVETVLEALSFLDFGAAPVVVEYFLACSSSALLPKLGTKLNRRSPNPNLRIRRVLFSEIVRLELKDLTFHALVLDDWLHSGAANWQQEEDEAEGQEGAGEQGQGQQQQQQQPEKAGPLAPSAAAMRFLARFLVPGAHLYVRGLAELPLWAALASQVSSAPLPLAPAGAAVVQAEWEATLAGYGDGPADLISVNAATPVLAGRFSRAAWERTAVRAGWVIAVAPSVEVRVEDVVKGCVLREETDVATRDQSHTSPNQDGRRLQAAIQAQQPDSTVDVLVVGKDDADGSSSDLTDASTWEDYERLLKGLLEPKDGEVGRRLQGIVFMAGVHDDGIMGEVGFGRLLRCVQVRCVRVCMCICDGIADRSS